MAQVKFDYKIEDSAFITALTVGKEDSRGDADLQVNVLNEGVKVDTTSISFSSLGYQVDEDGLVTTVSGGVVSDSDVKAKAIDRAKARGQLSGYNIDGQNYKEGDPYPKGADPNDETNDPTDANAPTEGSDITPITPIEAGTLPVSQPTLAPLPQGQGLQDATPAEAATLDPGVQRPEDKQIDITSYYTKSPLGLLISKQYDYKTRTDTLFSAKNYLVDKGKKTDTTDNTQTSALSDNPIDFQKETSDIHNSIVYNTSTNNIISKLEQYPALKLKWADFAYCRDFGVYPNNRLVVARRFESPVIDDLTLASAKVGSPISTLITWIDDSSNILEFSFGEEWVDAQVSFVELLNEVGEDFGLKFMKLGDALAGGLGVVPLPGATEGFQRAILAKLGIIGDSKTANIIPSGTPNLIKEARQRKLLKDETPGAGLTGKFNIKLKCAWEQKFISGVDPTVIYYDILQTILSFGGSQAVFYLGKKSNITGLSKFLSDNSGTSGALETITKVAEAFVQAIRDIAGKIKEQVKKLFDGENPPKDKEVDPNDQAAVDKQKSDAAAADQKAEEDRNKALKAATDAVDTIIKKVVDTIKQKYRVRVQGIIAALTGAPSTPWHVTVGNPLRPILSCGDMECSEVTVNLGPQLSFNDLPSYIECEFTLKSARNLGIDEIMEKLNCGSIRVQEEAPSFWNLLQGYDELSRPTEPAAVTGATPSPTPDPAPPAGATAGATGGTGESKVGNDIAANGQTINPDPNSAEALLGKVESLPGEEYTVKAGDSISKIAKNKLGPNASKSEILAETKRIISLNKNKNPAEVDGIVNTNSQSDPDFIKPGDKLFI